MELAVAAGTDELDLSWPGLEFRLGNPAFVALLGTAHGRGVVYLITQHASGLPGKGIEAVTMFTSKDPGFPNLYHLMFTLTGEGN